MERFWKAGETGLQGIQEKPDQELPFACDCSLCLHDGLESVQARAVSLEKRNEWWGSKTMEQLS